LSATEGFEDPPPAGQPSEEELRAAYEAELSRITTADMIAQAAISILNLGAHKLAPAGEGEPEGAGGRDLEQVRDAIDAARALIGILERRIPQELAPLRDAVSGLQMAYAKEVQSASTGGAPPEQGAPGGGDSGEGPGSGSGEGSGGGGAGGGADGGGASSGQPPKGPEQPGPGPAESSGRLWVPGK
jgi:hypothetical protein